MSFLGCSIPRPRKAAVLTLVSVGLIAVVLPAAASAATNCVGSPSGQTCATNNPTVQAAVTASVSGDTVAIGPGTFYGPVTVGINLHLLGSGASQTQLKPPPGGMTYGPGANYDFAIVKVNSAATVEIDNIEISGPDPDGNHCGTPGTVGTPALLNFGLLVEGGADVHLHDARVLSIRENPLGNCQYDHAINFRGGSHGRVENVVINDYQKTGFRASGVGTQVEVSDTSITGIAGQTTLAQNGAQLSSGVRGNFHDNTISGNTYGAGGDSETGILIFDADPATTVTGNTFEANDIGLYSYMSVPGGPVVANNALRSSATAGALLDSGATVFERNEVAGNPYGVYLSASAGQPVPNAATVRSNNITGNGTGIYFEDAGTPGSASPTVVVNRVFGNTNGAVVGVGSSGPYSVENNWWGCNAGPGSAGCDGISGALDADPRVVLQLNGPPSGEGGTSVPVSSLTQFNSSGTDISSLGSLPNGLPVGFSGSQAVPDASSVPLQTDSANNDALLAEALTTATVNSTLDNQTVSWSIAIFGNPPTDTTLPSVSSDGAVVSAGTGTWNGSGTITYSYQWFACDPAGSNCVEIPGAIAASFDTSSDQSLYGGTVRVRVTATNFAGTQVSTSGAYSTPAPTQTDSPVDPNSPNSGGKTTPVVAGKRPENVRTPTVISTAASKGMNFRGAAGTWTSPTRPGVTYQWVLCNRRGQNCKPVAGATGVALRFRPSFAGRTVRLRVTAKNVTGSTSASSPAVHVFGATSSALGACVVRGTYRTVRVVAAGGAKISVAKLTANGRMLHPVQRSKSRWTYRVPTSPLRGGITVVRSEFSAVASNQYGSSVQSIRSCVRGRSAGQGSRGYTG